MLHKQDHAAGCWVLRAKFGDLIGDPDRSHSTPYTVISANGEH
jgi:hypothetical protein